MHFFRSLAIASVCLLCIIEPSQQLLSSTFSNFSLPFSSGFIPRDTFISTRVIGLFGAIILLLRARSYTKIVVPIVKRIVVFMVHCPLISIRNSEDKSVHVNRSNDSIYTESGVGVKGFVFRTPRNAPFVFETSSKR